MGVQLDFYDQLAIYVTVAIGLVTVLSAVIYFGYQSQKVTANKKDYKENEYDYVVIGAGLGGLSCASMLAKYGFKVGVFESHYTAGGAAHSYQWKGKAGMYHFDSGPSLFGGLTDKGFDANPMGAILQAIDEPIEIHKYHQWNVVIPEGIFKFKIGSERLEFERIIAKLSGQEAVKEWHALLEKLKPLQKAVTLVPMSAIRLDPFVLYTVLYRYGRRLLGVSLGMLDLTKPFSAVMKGVIKDTFVDRYLNMLCFLLSGLPASGTVTAEMAFMFKDWYRDEASLDYPVGGSQAIVDALVRGLKKYGGELHLRSHVTSIITENNKAKGIEIADRKEQVVARKGVISAISVINTVDITQNCPEKWKKEVKGYPMCPSFMHIHLGFDATGLENLDLHHIVVDRWEDGVDAEQNIVLISIPTVVDPKAAPEGKHALHAYLPATEPYEYWKDLKQGSVEYEQLKEKRSQILWKALEKVIPDIRKRTDIALIGSPKTHQFWLNRKAGTYGPAFRAGKESFPLPYTPVKCLYQTGDSSFPGIGVPAVAASGQILANSLAPVSKQIKVLEQLGL